jgi:DNA-directed RNA polymerase specialized sigma24 family protein
MTPRQCRNGCVALTTESREPGADEPLGREHLPCVWREFQPEVRRAVIRTLLRLPLGGHCAALNGAGVAITKSFSLVRLDLVRSEEVQDLIQDMGCAMTVAVNRGTLAAARPAIYAWIQQTARWLVPQRARAAAISVLTGALVTTPANDNGADDPPMEPLIFGGRGPEDTVVEWDNARSALARLTRQQQNVLACFWQGMSDEATARALGMSLGAVRLHRMRLRRRISG